MGRGREGDAGMETGRGADGEMERWEELEGGSKRAQRDKTDWLDTTNWHGEILLFILLCMFKYM